MPLQDHKTGTALWLSALALLVALTAYASLGAFSRYIADDYCEAVRVTSVSPIQAVVDRYSDGSFRSANRYSNILFVGFSEMLGRNSIPITMVAMVVLWVVGLTWLVHETRILAGMAWTRLADVFFGGTLAFMSFVQAPNLFQTVYWRSSMMTHFAPLIFGSLTLAFLARQARRPAQETSSFLTYGVICFACFVLAGFSEPPAATLVVFFALLLLAIRLWNKSPLQNRRFALVGSAFAGSLGGLIVLILSPAVANVTREKSPDLVAVLFNSFIYALQFMRDSFVSLPLPLFLSFLTSLLLIRLLKQSGDAILPDARRLPLWMIVAPLVVWLLIAAGFSPSVFGQGFPVERMRFLARALLIATLMLDGVWLGLILPEFKINRTIGVWAPLLLFVAISTAYPLRAAFALFQNTLPEYRERAELWDLRDAYIHRRIAEGETDLFIPGFGGAHGVKELDSNPAHWINVCAANFYRVSSIQSFSTKDLLEALSE